MLLKNVVTSSPAKNGHTYIQWLIALLSASMFMGYGFQIGWVSPMKKILQSDASPTGSALTNLEMSTVAATATLAAIIFTLISMYIAEVWGRKTSILVMMAMHSLSWIIKLLATNTVVLVLARICSGPTLTCFSLLPMYVREISQDSIRGTLVSVSLSFQHIGVLAVYAMGSYLGYYTTLWIVLTISLVTLFLMFFAPESPVYLVKRGKFDEATRNLSILRGLNEHDTIIQNEINYMKTEDSYYKSVEKITFKTIFKNRAWQRGLILCQTIFIILSFNGTFAIVTYAWSILSEAGASISPDLLSLLVPVLMMLSAIVPMVCVERIGRKPLLVGACMLSVVSLGGLASALLAQHCGVAVPSWVHVATIAGAVSAYSAGMVPMANVIISEIFKFQIRAKLIGSVQMVAWTCVSLQLIFFDLVSSSLGLHTVFFACAGVNLVGAAIVLTFVPETGGLTTDQIEAILAGEKTKAAATADS